MTGGAARHTLYFIRVATSSFTGTRVFARIVGGTSGTQNVYDLLVRVQGP